MPSLIADQLSDLKVYGSPLIVSLSNELIKLLSDQLYQSPLKAIEELVINSYDADAKICRIFVPAPSDLTHDFIVIFDNGIGMNYEGLINLWQIGRSNKRIEDTQKKAKRKQIGKFGIGKLAARTIANKLTYITKSDKILSVTIDFRDFKDSPSNVIKPVETAVREINDWENFSSGDRLSEMIRSCNIKKEESDLSKEKTWTIAILEDLTEKAHKIKGETLQWILSTAMPLRSDFNLFLNGEQINSSKEDYDKWVEDFSIDQFPAERLKALKEQTGEEWIKDGEYLKCKSFPSGVKGTVFVTKPSLAGGKSEDLIRSYGFFIRVRGRLINDNDPLFGLKPLYFGLYYRFHADIEADDLDDDLKASRETIEETTLKLNFRHLLREIFNYTNSLYEQKQAEADDKKEKKEGRRNQVAPRLVEFQVADVLVENDNYLIGSEADQSWFYLTLDPSHNLESVITSLYTQERKKYTYQYIDNGPTARLVKFDPISATFWINKDHELAAEFINEGVPILLQDVVTAEALLEVYLRENQVPINIIGKVLEQRDELLRSLMRDRSYSFEAIARRLRDSASDKYELEISMVVAARALGFTATHIAGAGNPDGLALLNDYPDGEKKITLEAKSSESTPSLGAIDFAALQEHVANEKSDGCLLIAPSYPGDSRRVNAAARRAKELKISCWTIEQLARFVEAAEKRQLNAKNILEIVLNAFTPEEVNTRINDLLAEPKWDQRSLYVAILRGLKQLDGRLQDKPRTMDLVAGEVSREDEFLGIDGKSIEKAINDLAGASQGGMTLRDKNIILHVSVAELERRLNILVKNSGKPRRLSSFRNDE